MIILANDPRFLLEIVQSARSTLQSELIHFSYYNAVEIGDILSERAKQGIKRPDTAVISKIAAYTVKEANSDVRVGIKSLFYWATHGRVNVEKGSFEVVIKRYDGRETFFYLDPPYFETAGYRFDWSSGITNGS